MRKLIKIASKILGGLLLIGIGVWIGCEVAVEMVSWGRTYDELTTVPSREFGLVLGTSKFVAPGRENLHYKYRIEAAAELFNAGKVQRLVVSGNGMQANYNEPRMMKADLVARGVPPSRIISDPFGLRTYDSVVRAADVFHADNCVVISQASHNERAIFIGRMRGLDLVGWNARSVGFLTDPRTAVRERLARVLAVCDVALFRRSTVTASDANALSFASLIR